MLYRTLGTIWNRLKNPPGKQGKKGFFLTLGGFFLSSVCLTLLILWVGTMNFSFRRLFYLLKNPIIPILNYLPIAVLMGVLYFLCNRMWIAFLTTGAVSFLIAFVNHFKVQFRGEPFVALDLTLVAEGADAGGEFTYVFPAAFWIGIACIAVGTLLLAFFSTWRIPWKKWWLRPLGILLALGFTQFMWSSYYKDEETYMMVYLNDFIYFNDWNMAERYAKRGVMYSFIYSITDVVIQEPTDYDPKLVEALLGQHEPQQIPEERRVNLQIHMLESFSDLSELGLSFQKDPYVGWHQLEEESYRGTLIADVVGGGTVDTERSVMTGFTFPHPNYSIATNSYIRYFNDNGYFTRFTHPGNDWFYNRSAINNRLGFDISLFEQNYFSQYPDLYHGKDADLFPLLRELYLENIQGEEPCFAFNLTYQNHSPYESTVLLGEEYISDPRLDEVSYNILNNYLSGIEQTCNAVTSYVDMFRQDEEPVVMVFFGDHKATLGNNNSVYESLGINVDSGTPDGCYNIHSTPYLIWTNDAAKEILGDVKMGEGSEISPCYLMNEIFDFCGWTGNSWLQYQSTIRQQLPVIHRKHSFLIDGQITVDLPEELAKLRHQRNRVEFYLRYNLSE